MSKHKAASDFKAPFHPHEEVVHECKSCRLVHFLLHGHVSTATRLGKRQKLLCNDHLCGHTMFLEL